MSYIFPFVKQKVVDPSKKLNIWYLMVGGSNDILNDSNLNLVAFCS